MNKLKWVGDDTMGWRARATDDLVYEVKRSKARGYKWNVLVYENGAKQGQKLNINPYPGPDEAKAKAKYDFAERSAS